MNQHRKIKNFHINVPTHIMLNVPDWDQLFYCYETGSIDHTHIGIVLSKPMSKKHLIGYIVEQNGLEEHQVTVVSHTNWGTIWGYHMGFGDKMPCNDLVWISKNEDEVRTMSLNRRMHKAVRTCQEQKQKTIELLSLKPIECLREGMVSLRGYSGFKKDWAMAMKDNEEVKVNANPIALAPKKRHLWYWGASNTGKSTQAKSHGDYFVIPRNNDWSFYEGQKYILIEEFKGKFWTIDNLQELCDCDNYQVNTKGGSKLLSRDCVIVVTGRFSPDGLWKNENEEDLKGIFNRFTIINLTVVYTS